MSKVRILGIGSPSGDDQAGWLAVDALADCGIQGEHELAIDKLDRPGASLIGLLEHADWVILVDAMQSGDRPGRIKRFDQDAWPGYTHGLSSPGLGVLDALSLARAFGMAAKSRSPAPATRPATTSRRPRDNLPDTSQPTWPPRPGSRFALSTGPDIGLGYARNSQGIWRGLIYRDIFAWFSVFFCRPVCFGCCRVLRQWPRRAGFLSGSAWPTILPSSRQRPVCRRRASRSTSSVQWRIGKAGGSPTFPTPGTICSSAWTRARSICSWGLPIATNVRSASSSASRA